MKRSFVIGGGLLFCLTLSWACAPLLPYPTEDALLRVQTEIPDLKIQDLEIGRRRYAATCASCHSLHLPSEFPVRAWEKIIVRMQVKARIDDSTRDSILYYLIAVTAKN